MFDTPWLRPRALPMALPMLAAAAAAIVVVAVIVVVTVIIIGNGIAVDAGIVGDVFPIPHTLFCN